MGKKQGIRAGRIAVGTHACMEALKVSAHLVDEVMLKKDSSSRLDFFEKAAQKNNWKLTWMSGAALDKVAAQNQGVAVRLNGQPQFDWDGALGSESCFLLGVDGVEDPHNLGAIVRTAWLMGVSGIFLSQHQSVGLTPAAHKVACGGVEHVPVEKVNKFSDIVPRLKESGFWVYGLEGADGRASSVFDYQPAQKTLLIVGSEEKGVRETTLRQCDASVGIPQLVEGPSYNASVAAAIAMAETRRQLGDMTEK